MTAINLVLLGWLALMLGCMSAAAMGNDRLARESKPLDQIVQSLEGEGYVVVEAEVDDGRWEVDVQKGDEAYELHIDTATGNTIATHRDDADPTPSAQAMKLSELLKGVNKSGYTSISSLQFKRGKWEMEVRKGRVKREIEVDAKSGKVLSDRIDD